MKPLAMLKNKALTLAKLNDYGYGKLAVSGEMSFGSVPNLWQLSEKVLRNVIEDNLELDLAEVTKIDSAGLALLVAWQRWAHSQRKSLRFSHISPQLVALAKANNLNSVLGLESNLLQE